MNRFSGWRSGWSRLLLATALMAVIVLALGALGGYALPSKHKPKPSAAQYQYTSAAQDQYTAQHGAKPKKTSWRSSLYASVTNGPAVHGVSPSGTTNWTLKKGRADLKAGSPVRVKVRVKDLKPVSGSTPALGIGVYCGTTLATPVIPVTLPANGELHVNTDVTITGPCWDPAVLVLDTSADPDKYVAAPAIG